MRNHGRPDNNPLITLVSSSRQSSHFISQLVQTILSFH